jgi:hypothetical protein
MIEDAALRDDDHGIEDVFAVRLDADQLMGQPGDGVRFAAAGGVLDEIALAEAALSYVG